MNTFLLNLEIGCCVCIDWDIYFEDFERIAIPYTKTLIQFTRSRLTQLNNDLDVPVKAYYQRSAKGNVHVWLRLPEPVTIFDSLMIRAWMGDDRTRLQLDMARYFRNGSPHEMNQCFDEKIVHEGGRFVISKAGPKIKLDYTNNENAPTTSEAHTMISNMQDEVIRQKRQRKAKKQQNLGQKE